MLFNSTSSSSNSVGAMTLKGSSISERLSLSSAELSSDRKMSVSTMAELSTRNGV